MAQFPIKGDAKLQEATQTSWTEYMEQRPRTSLASLLGQTLLTDLSCVILDALVKSWAPCIEVLPQPLQNMIELNDGYERDWQRHNITPNVPQAQRCPVYGKPQRQIDKSQEWARTPSTCD